MAVDEITNKTWLEFKQRPSIETRNYILMHYLHLVKEIACRLAPVYVKHIEYDDLYGYGIFGLMDAIEKYDVTKGIKFETYAAWRIRGSIIDQIREQDWLPKSMRQKFKKVEEAYRSIERKTGLTPTDEQVANYLNINLSELNKIYSDSYFYQVVSMDETIMDITRFNDESDSIPEQSFIKAELEQTIKKAVNRLTKNESMVVSLYYYDGLNQKEIGKVMGLTESRISQLHSRALIKLKASIEKSSLIEH